MYLKIISLNFVFKIKDSKGLAETKKNVTRVEKNKLS